MFLSLSQVSAKDVYQKSSVGQRWSVSVGVFLSPSAKDVYQKK